MASKDEWKQAFEDILVAGINTKAGIMAEIAKKIPTAKPNTLMEQFSVNLVGQDGPDGRIYVMRTVPRGFKAPDTAAPSSSQPVPTTQISVAAPADVAASALKEVEAKTQITPTQPAEMEKWTKYSGEDPYLRGTLWRLRDEDKGKSENADPWEVRFEDGTKWQFDVPTRQAYDEYIPRQIGSTTDLKIIQKLLDDKRPVMIQGHLGIGKTLSVFAAAADPSWEPNRKAGAEGWQATGEPWKLPRVYRAVMSQMQYEQLIGSVVPNPNRKTQEAPPFVWEDGVLTKMVRYGGIFFADEINLTAPDVLSALNSLLDGSHSIMLAGKGGELVRAHKNFRLVAAMNPSGFGYIGVKPLNMALKSRFDYWFWFSWSTEVEKTRFPELRNGKDDQITSQVTIANVHRYFAQLRGLFVGNRIHYPVGMRDMIHFIKNLRDFGPRNAMMSLLQLFETDEEKKDVLEAANEHIKGHNLTAETMLQ